jgi:Outer membrane protein beta-barrel family/CarboxypepD_reg-like domain
MRTVILMLIPIVCCMPSIAFSQHKISGKITDGQKGLPSVTVVLISPSDSSIVKGEIADAEGSFVMEGVGRGSFQLKVSMIGYYGHTSVIEVGNEDLVLSDIVLVEAATELDEVVVRAEKTVLEQRSDRLVLNIQSSITSAGNTVIEVLQKSPGVTINRQSSVISMNGRSGVRIMLNGKLLQMPPDAAMQMLDGMNASGVERIEFITVPPSKFDAEGNAGIINIVTKQNSNYGTSGSVGILFGYKWAETTGGNFNISHRSKSTEWFVDYSMMRTRNLHSMTLDSHWTFDGYPRANESSSYRPNLTNQHNLSTGLHINLSEKVSLNFLLSGYRRNWTLNALTNDLVKVNPDSSVATTMHVYEKNLWESASGSMGLAVKPNTRSELEFNFDYLYYRNDNPSSYNNSTQNEQSVISLTKDTPIRMFVGRADYHYSFSPELTIEAGVKGVQSGLDNDVDVRREENSSSVIDSAFTSNSHLSEEIGAAYLSTNWKLSKATDLTTGLRYEYTHTAIHSVANEVLVDRKYGYLFPNVVIRTTLAPERDVQFSYSRRITRPTYNDIAPFVFFWGPNTFSAGNTSLWPAVSDAFSASYHNRRLTAIAQYSHTNREIINLFQPERDTINNSVVFRSQNLVYLNTLSLSASWSFKPAEWWEVQPAVTTLYQVARTGHFANNVTMKLGGVNVNLTSVMQFKKGVSMEVSGFFQSTSFYGVSRFLPYGTLNAGVQKKFANSSIKLSMDDILYTNVWRVRTLQSQEGIDSYIVYDWHNQFVRLTYTYNFGHTRMQSVKIKSGSGEEQKRVN